jgi:serine/threonine protein kinase
MEECPYSEFRKIGEGTYGSVYKILTKDGWMLALKEGSFSPNEVDIMARLDHPNLIRMIYFLTPNICPELKGSGIIMPLAHGDIYDLITMRITPEARIKMMANIAKGLAFLHSTGALHLDLKLANILYQGSTLEPIPIIADFGLVQYVDDIKTGQYIDRKLVTVTYRAPEILHGSRFYNEAVDVWSLGMIFLEILSKGRSAFEYRDPEKIDDDDIMRQIDQIFTDQNRPGWIRTFLQNSGLDPKYLNDSVRLLTRMLDPNPNTRATMEEVLNSSLFQKLEVSGFLAGINRPAEEIVLNQYDPLFDQELDWLLSVMFSAPFFSGLPVSALFLAVDLYNRLLPFLPPMTGNEEEDQAQMRTLTTSILYLIREMMGGIPINQPSDTINKYSGIPKEYVDATIPIIISSLQGILYPVRLYGQIKSAKQLKEAYREIASVKNYVRLDPKKWVEEHPPDQTKKEMIIAEYYNLLMKDAPP